MKLILESGSRPPSFTPLINLRREKGSEGVCEKEIEVVKVCVRRVGEKKNEMCVCVCV